MGARAGLHDRAAWSISAWNVGGLARAAVSCYSTTIEAPWGVSLLLIVSNAVFVGGGNGDLQTAAL